VAVSYAGSEPIFILGFPRSGTTLLGQILASRPRTALLEEHPLLAAGIADFVEPPDGPEQLAHTPDSALDFYRADFWQRVRALGVDTTSSRLIDQTALNTVYLPLILRLFPQSRIVFAIRDPRDVVLGCFRQRFAPNRFTLEMQTLEGAARLYVETMQLAQTCRQTLGFVPLDIRNEDVITDFDRQTRRLCAFVDLPWDDSIRDFQRAAPHRSLLTASSQQVRQGLRQDGMGRWRRYAGEMATVLPALEPWAELFGYPPD
jgi:hypothetical protein